MAAEQGGKSKNGRVPLLESVSAAIGLALLAAMVGFLAYEGVTSDNGTPPVMTVEPEAVTASAGQYVVEVRIANRSRKTAASVQVEGVLTRGGSEVETGSASFDYVPGKSERKGAMVFTSDPREHALQLRVTGYQQP